MRLISLFALLCLFATGLHAAPDGAALYARHCAACHGGTGHGGVGVPLALPDFLAVATDDYLAKTIRLGRPGRVMPASPQLSDAQIGAIVRYVRSWAPVLAAPSSLAPIAGDVARGKGLYAKHCASCHGANGEGGAGTGVTFSRPRELAVVAPALNNPGFLDSASDHIIKSMLVEGRKGTPMPSLSEMGLGEKEVDDIVTYLRFFADHAPASSATVLEAEQAVLVFDSPYSVEQTAENIRRAAVGRNYRIIRSQYLEQGLVPEGQENKNQVIVYFCNFQQLNDSLAIDPRVGLFLPCRATVVERGGRVQVMSINPKSLSKLFNNSELNQACDAMYKIYMEILEEATL